MQYVSDILQRFSEPDWLMICLLYIVLLFLIYNFSSYLLKRLGCNSDKYPKKILFFFYIIIVIEICLRVNGTYSTYLERIGNKYETLYNFRPQKEILKRSSNESIILDSKEEFSYKFHTNSNGYSDIEWDSTEEGYFRIVALGDSFTEGFGADQDSSWVAHIRRLYRNKKVKWFNAGISASDPFNNFYNLANDLKDLNPDLIIQIYTNQDFEEDVLLRGGYERYVNGKLLYVNFSNLEYLYAYSHIFRIFYNQKSSKKYFVNLSDLKNYNAKEKFDQLVELYKGFSETKGIPVILIFFHTDSYYYIMNGSKYLLDFRNEIKYGNVYIRSLYDCYNVESTRLQEDFRNLWWKNDGHHNSKGYELMSRCIYEEIHPIVDSLYLIKKDTFIK